jgi:hypothetical protein
MKQPALQKLDTLSNVELCKLFYLDKISTLKRNFNVNWSEFSVWRKQPSQNARFDVFIDSQIYNKKHTVLKTANIKLIDVEIVLVDFSHDFLFVHDKNYEFYSVKDKEYVLDPRFDDFTNKDIIDTSRGILFGFMQGTPLQDTFLPLVPPKTQLGL